MRTAKPYEAEIRKHRLDDTSDQTHLKPYEQLRLAHDIQAHCEQPFKTSYGKVCEFQLRLGRPRDFWLEHLVWGFEVCGYEVGECMSDVSQG